LVRQCVGRQRDETSELEVKCQAPAASGFCYGPMVA
jgi:hypothetical protein